MSNHSRWINVFCTLVFLLSSQIAYSQQAKPPQKENKDAASVEEDFDTRIVNERKLGNNVTLVQLKNGLTIIVQENHSAPVATVRCYVKNTGSTYEGKYLGAGISHVLEHVVAGGSTRTRTEKEIEKIIDSFGGATNAYTTHDRTVYFIDCPARNTLEAVDLVADSMQNVIFNPEEFARELEVVQRELADGEVNRRRVLFNMLNQLVYTEHPQRHPIIGYKKVLAATTNEEIIDFYKTRYIPNNQIFVVVGDVNTDEIIARVRENWKGTPRKWDTDIAFNPEPDQLSPREAYREMDGKTIDFVYAWPTVKLSHEDLYALDVASYILTQGDSSRMVRRLKYDEESVLAVSSASYTPAHVKGFFAIFGSCNTDKLGEASVGVLEEVYRLKAGLVSDGELAKAKKQKATEQVFARQQVKDAAESLGISYMTTADPLYDEQYVKGIQKVTKEQIQAVAEKYFVPEKINRVVLAPIGFSKEETQVEEQKTETDVKKIELANGITVLLKKQSQLPLINMQLYTLGASLVETPENAGISGLTARVMDKGSKNYSGEEIADYFDSIGGSFGVSSGRNSVYASMTVLTDDFEESIKRFADSVLFPSFPEDAFATAQRQTLGAIAAKSADPQSEVFEVFYKSLPASSPYHVIRGGTEESVKGLKLEDLKAYHEKYFVPNNMVITIFGDIPLAEAEGYVNKYFAALKPDSSFEKISFKRDNTIKETIVEHKQIQKDAGMVLVGYEGPNIFEKEDESAMVLLDAITSGYQYPGGWLHNELRGEGLVYYVHAFMLNGPVPGYFAVLSQTSPDSVEEVVTRIKKNVEKAKAGRITEDEFENAKMMVMALNAQSATTISSQAQLAAINEMYGLGYNYHKTFDERISKVTLDEVVNVAKKYLNKSITVTASPAEKSPLK